MPRGCAAGSAAAFAELERQAKSKLCEDGLTGSSFGRAHRMVKQIAAAYDLNPKTVSGGPAWIETDP